MNFSNTNSRQEAPPFNQIYKYRLYRPFSKSMMIMVSCEMVEDELFLNLDGESQLTRYLEIAALFNLINLHIEEYSRLQYCCCVVRASLSP